MDLKLSPYQVIATSGESGFVECVTPSTALSHVLAKGDIKTWLQEHNKGEGELEEALDNFIKSCGMYLVF